MNCAQTKARLRAYLDQELEPAQVTRLQMHLQTCLECQNELAQLTTLQTQLRAALQQQAKHAVPSPDAWQRLETRLQLAPPLPHTFIGGKMLRKPMLAAAAVCILVVALVGIWIFSGSTPVSAQQILNRSAETQQASQVAKGIQHTQTQIFFNPQAVPPPKQAPGQAVTNLMDSYRDPQTGMYRTVVRNKDTNQISDAFGFDGVNLYTAEHKEGQDTVTTIYRTLQAEGVGELIKKDQQRSSGDWDQTEKALGISDQQLFDKMRNDSANTTVTQETWENGRTVYALHQQAPLDPVSDDDKKKTALAMTSVLYFDVKTYTMLGQANYTTRDGQEVMFYSSRILLDETLPADTHVAWDMTDLTDVKIVDDPNGEFGDQLPAPISAKQLTERVKNAYLLKSVPDGFTLQITAPPHPRPDEPAVYMADYRNAADDYFFIQGGMGSPPNLEEIKDVYTTRSGIKLYFDIKRAPDGYSTAAVVAPDGTTFLISAKLPRDRVEQLAEDLVKVE